MTFLVLGACEPDAFEEPLTGLRALRAEPPLRVIGDELLFQDAADLPAGPERERSRAVALLELPADQVWCTGALIGVSALLTAHACVPDVEAVRGAQAAFRRETGVRESEWARYPCETLWVSLPELGAAVLRCEGRPGDTFGVLGFADVDARLSGRIEVMQQTCPMTQEPCAPDKWRAPGEIVGLNESELFVDADGLPGALGAPVISVRGGRVIGVLSDGAPKIDLNRVRRLPGLEARLRTLGELEAGPRPSAFGSPSWDEDRFEPNDAEETATEVSPGFTADVVSIDEGDVDIYRVFLMEGMRLRVSITHMAGWGDLDVDVYEGRLEGPIVGQGRSIEDLEVVDVVADESVPHFVVVYGFRGATNRYALSLSLP